MSHASDKHRSATLTIEGMHCASCELMVERKLKAVPGVLNVDVDHTTGCATIEADPNRLPKEEDIAAAVQKAGYTLSESTSALTHTITNNTGLPLTVSSVLRSDLARCIASVTKDGAPTAYTLDNATGRITVSSPLNTGAAAQTVFTVLYLTVGSPDFDGDGDQGTDLDIEAFFACLGGDCCATCGSPDFDQDGDQGTDLDIEAFFRVLGGGAC